MYRAHMTELPRQKFNGVSNQASLHCFFLVDQFQSRFYLPKTAIIFIIQECEQERDWQNRGEKYKPLRLNFCKLWDAIKKDDVNKHRT